MPLPKNDICQRIVDCVFKQTGVDLNLYRTEITRSFDTRNKLVIVWSSISEANQRLILENAGVYSVAEMGKWMRVIELNKLTT